MTSPLLCSPCCSPDHEEEFKHHRGDDDDDNLEVLSSTSPSEQFVIPSKPINGRNTNRYQADFIESIKKNVSNRDSHTMTIIRSNPNFVFEYLRTENGRPHDAREYCVKGVRIFAPHLQGIPVQSPCCRSASTAKQFVTGDPTKCYGMEDYHYILSYRYQCGNCGRFFNALNPGSVEQLPTDVKIHSQHRLSHWNRHRE